MAGNIEEVQNQIASRVVKFNAWHKEQKKMYLAEELGQDQLTLMPDGRGFANISSTSTKLSEVDHGERMIPLQYIGLKDCEGKELFHGNIVIDDWNNRWIIDWSNEYAGFELTLIKAGELGEFPKLNICRVAEMKFIGTIFENPELLKETK